MRNSRIKNRILATLLLVAILFFAGESFAGKISLKAKDTTERTRGEPREDRHEDQYGNSDSTFTLTETEICTLALRIKGTKELSGIGQLECYFLSKNMKSAEDKGTVVIFSSGKKEISFGDAAILKETVTSEPFVFTKQTFSRGYPDKRMGDSYKGYIVLLKQNGEILAQCSNSSLYLRDDWIEQCEQFKSK